MEIEDRLRERDRCGGFPSEGDGVCRRKSLWFVAFVVVVFEEKPEKPDRCEENELTLDGSALLLLELLLEDEVLSANGWDGLLEEWPCEDDGGS